MFRSRTFIGILCIIFSIVLFFCVLPLFIGGSSNGAEIVVAAGRIPAGTLITADRLKTVKGGSGVSGAISDKNLIIGKYASIDIPDGDVFLQDKLSAEGSATSLVLGSLGEGECAVTVPVSSFSGAFSGQLENGDVVRIYVYDGTAYRVPEELQYVRVISTVTNDGATSDSAGGAKGSSGQASSVMFRVTDRQALVLLSSMKGGTYHCAFLCRGSDPRAAELLAEQTRILNAAEEAYAGASAGGGG